MPAKPKGLKWGAQDDKEPKWTPRRQRVVLPDSKGSPLRMYRGEVGEEPKGEEKGAPSVTADGIMEQIEELLKCTEVTWGSDPMPELAQCILLACWAAAEASSMVEEEEEEGRLGKLEVALAIVKMCLIEARGVQQCWQDIAVYREAGRELAWEKWDLESGE
jgi:hypothetical protein